MSTHTDPQALDDLYTQALNWPRTGPAPAVPWYRALWLWIEEQFWKERVEAHPAPDPIARRIRVHRVGTRYARRLSNIDPGEAREILGVTAMLLGFGSTVRITRRAHEVSRS
jgi:hypothetical protein